jgi:hypothetical protein
MTSLQMPKVDKSILSNKDKIALDLRKILKSENILSHEDEIRPYETDALAAYKQKPLLVVLPETVEQVSEILENPNNYPMIPPSGKEDRIERFVQFIEMICIDGVIVAKEEKLANKYGIALGYKSEQVIELEAIIIDKLKAGVEANEIIASLM